jgi:mRNA interferase MazF
MKVRRGDVIIIDHPFSDASGSKVRPALVVQSDARNAILRETVIALISRNLSHVGTDQTQVLIEVRTTDGKTSGLNADSVVKCGKLFTIHEGLVRRRIGSLPGSLMYRVVVGLKTALEIQ